MQAWLKKLLLFFLILSIAKSILAFITPGPSAFSDNFSYIKMAWSIFHLKTPLIYGEILGKYPPLYPLIISISYSFKNMIITYGAIKVFNAFLSSIMIFPIYLIARDFLKEKDSLMVTGLTALITPHFIFPNYIMAENLFFPLISLTIYFMYKAFKSHKKIDFIFSGLVLGLSILTKIIGIALVPVVFFTYLILKRKERISKLIMHYAVIIITIAPYFLWRLWIAPENTLGYTHKTTVGYFLNNLTVNIDSFFTWHINYLGYTMLACGILFAIFFLGGLFVKKEKNLKIIYTLTALSSILFIFIAANHSSTNILTHSSPFTFYTYRPMGRYIAAIFPLIFLNGFIIYKKNILNLTTIKNSTYISAIILGLSSTLTLSALFPINNSGLAFVGILQYTLEYILYSKMSFDIVFYWGSFILMALILIAMPFIFLRFKKYATHLIVGFLIINALFAYSVHLWNVNTYWDENNQTLLGKWVNLNIDKKKVILMDNSKCSLESKHGLDKNLCFDDSLHSSLVTFWINNPLITSESISNKGDYIITQQLLDKHNLIKSFGQFRLYEKKNNFDSEVL